MEIEGKVALVTGAGYGIGRGIALRLGAAGAAVVVDDIHEKRGRQTVEMIEGAGGQAAFVHADVSVDADVRRMIAFAKRKFGGLDILVNNAGFPGEPPYFPEARPSRWQRVFDVYLRAVMVCIQHGIRAMEQGGVVVNISSAAGTDFQPGGWPEYGAAKAAVVRLTTSLGDLKARMNVRVNCICPAWVATEKVQARVATMTARERAAERVPDPMLKPTDIGDAVVDFVRDDSLAGRVLLYYAPGRRRLVPVGFDLFAASEE